MKNDGKWWPVKGRVSNVEALCCDVVTEILEDFLWDHEGVVFFKK